MGTVTVHNVAEVLRFHGANAEKVAKYERLAEAAERFIRTVLIADGGAKPHLEPLVKQAEADFLKVIEKECPDSNDKKMALELARNAIGLALFMGPALGATGNESIDDPNSWTWIPDRTQIVIKWIRNAKMWASAAVALDGMI